MLMLVCLLACSAADFDYVRVGRQLEFVESATAPVSDCVQIKLLDDNLAESEEWFTIQIYTQWTPENAPDDQLRLQIQPSDSEWRKEQSVCVFRGLEKASRFKHTPCDIVLQFYAS